MDSQASSSAKPCDSVKKRQHLLDRLARISLEYVAMEGVKLLRELLVARPVYGPCEVTKQVA